jgi:hypothetical protein
MQRQSQQQSPVFPLPLGTGSYIRRDQNPFECASHFRQQVSRKHIFSPPNYFGCCKAVLLADGCRSGARNSAYLRGEHNSLQVQMVLVRLIHVQHSMISVPLVITNFRSRV